MPLPLATSSSTCPRCAVDTVLPAYGGVHHFWNVCDSCRSNTFVHDPQQRDGQDEQMASYSKEDEELSALFASADFSLTHRPHLWEPSDRPPAYALLENNASLKSEPLRGVTHESAIPRQDPALQAFRQQQNESQHHAYHHPPLGIADRRLEEDSTMARTQPLQQQNQQTIAQQQQQQQPQIYYASAHYNHSSHVATRQIQQQQQQQQQHHHIAEPYMHDGYAHMQSSGEGLWPLPSDHALPGGGGASRQEFGQDDVDMGG